MVTHPARCRTCFLGRSLLRGPPRQVQKRFSAGKGGKGGGGGGGPPQYGQQYAAPAMGWGGQQQQQWGQWQGQGQWGAQPGGGGGYGMPGMWGPPGGYAPQQQQQQQWGGYAPQQQATPQPSADRNKLFVGNIPLGLTKEELKAVFEPMGELSEEPHILPPKGTRGTGCGFVRYTHVSLAPDPELCLTPGPAR
jgi:hypothetical protein